ncbi:hypothetical protein SFRURICE_015841, partial [Spodoptera frugiperda]
DSPPDGGDRVGEATACSELLDGAEEPEMGSGGGGLCADTWPAPPRGRHSARLSEPSREPEGPSGSGARRKALDSSGKSHTRAPSLKGSYSESDCSSVSGVSIISRRHTRSTFKRPRMEEEAGERPSAQAATTRSKPAKRLAAEDALGSSALSDSSIKKISDADGMQGERDTGTLRQTVRDALGQLVEAEIMAAAFDLCRVPSAGKVHQELAAMRQELAEMRQKLARLFASNAALETKLREMKRRAAFQQRFNVLESIPLRPSLAASSSATSSSATSRSYAAVAPRSLTSSGQTGCGAQQVARPQAAPPARTPALPAVHAPASPAANASSGRKRRRRGAAAQQAEALATGAPTPTARGPDGSGVAGRRRGEESRQRSKKAPQESATAAAAAAAQREARCGLASRPQNRGCSDNITARCGEKGHDNMATSSPN